MFNVLTSAVTAKSWGLQRKVFGHPHAPTILRNCAIYFVLLYNYLI